MAKNKVEITGIDTSTLKTLNTDEMNNLFIELQKGNRSAKNTLIEGNLKLVLSILRKYQNRCDNLDDLFQIGTIGLIKAIDNFDLSFGVKFSTYAVLMIEGEIKRYIRDNNSIRVSRSLKDIAYKTLRLKESYIQDKGEEPSLEYIAKELNVSEGEIISALDSLKDPISMFEPVYNDGGDTIYLCDQIEDKREINRDFSSHVAIEEAMSTLKERERQILDKRFIIGKTQMEIADEIGISQAQVSRLEKRAIKQLKKVLK